MKLAFIAAAWLIGVLIGLETRTPLAPMLLLPGGSITLGLALRLPNLPVFPAVLALLWVLGAWRADVAPSLSLAGSADTRATLGGRISSDPETAGSRAEFTLDLGAADSTGGRILVYAPPIRRPGRPPLSALIQSRRHSHSHRNIAPPRTIWRFRLSRLLGSPGHRRNHVN